MVARGLGAGRGEARLSNVGLRQMVYLSVTPISISRHQSPPDQRGHIHQHLDSLTFPLRPTKSTSTQAKFSHCVCLGQNNAKLTHLPYKLELLQSMVTPIIRCRRTCFLLGQHERLIRACHFPEGYQPTARASSIHVQASAHVVVVRPYQDALPMASPANLILDPSGQ